MEKCYRRFYCLSRGENERDGFAFLQYIERVPSLHKVNKDLGCVCVQWVPAGSVAERHDRKKRGGDTDAVAPCEWFGAIPLQMTAITVHNVCPNILVFLISENFSRSGHRFQKQISP